MTSPDEFTRTIGKHVLRYDSVVSTNSIGKRMAEDGVEEGTVVLAKTQTGGRGRKKRSWHSPPGGLWFSVVLYPDMKPDTTMLATMAASISISEALKKSCGIQGSIKWPNDVLIGGKKAAGVLTELHFEDRDLQYLVLGVGINVNNELPDDLTGSATSLKIERGADIDTDSFFEVLLKSMDDVYRLIKERRYDRVKELWLENTDMVGKKVHLHENDSYVEGKVKGIDKKGRLLLDTRKGWLAAVSGDLEIVHRSRKK
ncbi:MAG: biotin--[acetyl-CoA-carboxylase] ligase [Thermoplasmata archaeon]